LPEKFNALWDPWSTFHNRYDLLKSVQNYRAAFIKFCAVEDDPDVVMSYCVLLSIGIVTHTV